MCSEVFNSWLTDCGEVETWTNEKLQENPVYQDVTVAFRAFYKLRIDSPLIPEEISVLDKLVSNQLGLPIKDRAASNRLTEMKEALEEGVKNKPFEEINGERVENVKPGGIYMDPHGTDVTWKLHRLLLNETIKEQKYTKALNTPGTLTRVMYLLNYPNSQNLAELYQTFLDFIDRSIGGETKKKKTEIVNPSESSVTENQKV